MTAPTMKELKSLVYIKYRLRSDTISDEEKARMRFRIARMIDFIEHIEDPMTHDIFAFRFIRGFTWVKTAHKVGGGNSADGVRMIVKRYLEKR